MEPGQAAVRTGVLVADSATGLQEQLALGVEVPWSDRWSVVAQGAVLYNAGFMTRDSSLGARARVIDKPGATLRIEPGVSLPTGSAGANLAYTPLSTGSVDPQLSIDLVTGSTWVLASSAKVRVPLYDGLDGSRQGPYGYIDVRAARRLSAPVIPYIGLSGAAATQVDAFTELAALAGAVWAPNERWALGANARVPWQSHYTWAAGISVSRVVGAARDDHQHD